MDITKLTIHGFKSFYDKSVFTFGRNITAIVGPNGSGKSNITESIRFVLGEQGAKAMRGKDITDMLFRGGSLKSNKCKVEIVFKRNSNFRIINNDTVNVFVKNALEKEEVIIARTLFSDGKSVYEVNGVEVRQKDVQEFLLYVHLGNKSSWHISQGEADKVLSANPQDRKTLIEDALGLKVYHARINESIKKLDKTRDNIREASLQRKELLPELTMLARTVEKIQKSADYRRELTEKAKAFLSYRKSKIADMNKNIGSGSSVPGLQEQIKNLEEEIGRMQAVVNKSSGNNEEILQNEINKEERILGILDANISKLKSELQNYENIFSYSNLEEDKILSELKSLEQELGDNNKGNDIIFSEGDINHTKQAIELSVEKILNNTNHDLIRQEAAEIDLSYKKLLSRGSVVSVDNIKEISYLQSIKSRLQEKLRVVRIEKDAANLKIIGIKPNLETEQIKTRLVNEKISDLQKQILEFKYLKIEQEKDLQNKIFARSGLQIKLSELQVQSNRITEMEKELERELFEFENILGSNFAGSTQDFDLISEEESYQLYRNIERLKLRLEESMITNPTEVLDKHKELASRDEFLLKEISDLENSMANLEMLILDLKNSLAEDFNRGLEHINSVFDSYVKKLFSGGSAKVYEIEIENKKNLSQDQDASDSEIKTGIEVEVEIPKKKIKGLHTLSGGERALVSIALNFSIINQNPAPFMILDETDAALDEANSKRYGEILEMLKEKTKLIVVTHNRETMHFADQIFGVTLHKDGHSKILSVSFDDAVEWAK